MNTHKGYRIILALICLNLLLVLTIGDVNASPLQPAEAGFATIDAYITEQMNNLGIPGMALGIVDRRRVAVAGEDGVLVWDLALGQAVAEPLDEHLGEVYSVVFSPDGRFLVSGGRDDAIVIRDATTLEPIREPLDGHLEGVTALAVDPQTPSILYAGTDVGIFKSADGGTSWTVVNKGLTNLDIIVLAIDPTASQTLYAGTNGGGLFKSSDGARNWSAANTGLTNLIVQSMAIDPLTSYTLYAGTAGGVFKSTDGGAGWVLVGSGFRSDSILSLAIHPQNPSIVAGGRGQRAEPEVAERRSGVGAAAFPAAHNELAFRDEIAELRPRN